AEHNRHLLALSAQIVASHAGNNPVRTDALPAAIRNVYNTLVDLHPPAQLVSAPIRHTHNENVAANHDHGGHSHRHVRNEHVHPAYGQTVFGDHLICMEDGLSMKMLKRHLLTVHGMTPDEYREKWGLPESYPMVASEYAKLRSSLALQSGLGLKPEDRPAKARRARRG